MSRLIVLDWTPEWAESSAAAAPPPSEAGGASEGPEPGATPKRRIPPSFYSAPQPKARPGTSKGSLEEGGADLESAAALLVLFNGGRPHPARPKSAVASSAERARPGPRPQSKFMGVTRHVKGMWNAQLWLAGQTRQEHVGGFPTTEAAAAAHDIAALVIKGPDAKTNYPKETYDGLWQGLRGKDWPALRQAIKAIVRDDLALCGPEPASPAGTPGGIKALPMPTPPPGAKRDRGEMLTPPNLPPAKRARSDGSPELTISGLTNKSDTPSDGEHEASPTENVRKSGRAREIPGRLIALNGEDPKLLHAPRRKRKGTLHLDLD